MFKLLKALFQLLTPDQRRRFFLLQILVALMAIMELVGIASIGPFMALVADIHLLQTNAIYRELYAISGLNDPGSFLFLTGIIVLFLLAFASIVSIFTTWRLSMFSFSIGSEIADRLYQHYLKQSWLFHTTHTSAQLTRQIATESGRVTSQIINPLMTMNSRLLLATFISVAIFIYNPVIALSGLALFTSGYLIIYRIVQNRLARNGKNITLANAQRFRLMNEAFGGIKDILLLNRQQSFIEQFQASGDMLARAQGKNQAYSQTPRYFMELLAFGAMIGLVLTLLKLHSGELHQVLPILAVYALAGFKLLPALQQIYACFAQIKGNLASLESIAPDLAASAPSAYGQKHFQGNNKQEATTPSFSLAHARTIRLDNITFTYPCKTQPALNQLNLTIPINSTIGLVGESGSGKSTTIDLLLALITPDQGQLMLDNSIIDKTNRLMWQQHIAFVPQSIFLGEGTIAENIAFGLKKQDINLDQVQNAIRLAHLEEFVQNLPEGLHTKVGERGIQLSGGQRQRIGIARALYNQAEVLVFDEATSSLDGITEKIIMDAIHQLAGKKTIILVAHRLKTVGNCDLIYLMENGRVIAQGTYGELLEKNPKFREMARHA